VCVLIPICITHKLMNYTELTSIENLFQAWNEFKLGKRNRRDVQIFERFLEDNLFDLHEKLKNKTYRHGNYKSFFVHDPKLRHIHKATVEDRIIHHLLYKYLYGVFDKIFIDHSYSCRLGKGTHKGVDRLDYFIRRISRNYIQTCWVLKLDIKKYFASVNHKVLILLLSKKIKDKDILWLLSQIIGSFCTCHPEQSERYKLYSSASPQNDCECRGIPLGNLTSQVFANIYMNELDQFIKHKLKVKYYLRYADDFIILSISKNDLNHLIKPIELFLKEKLKLDLHPDKIIFRRFEWGIDFLGYLIFKHHRLPRTKTKRRIFKKLKYKVGNDNFNQSFQSYLGYLQHANSFKLTQQLKNQIWFWEHQ